MTCKVECPDCRRVCMREAAGEVAAHRWHWAGTHGEWRDGAPEPRLRAELEARESYRLELAYTRPSADAQDAARYRWLRSQESQHLMTERCDMIWTNTMSAEQLDAAIDAALRPETGPEGK